MEPHLDVIFLSGGRGKRFGSPIPKQYHLLADRCIASYSLELFLSLPEVHAVVVVCDQKDRDHFALYADRVCFADPGPERQDSLKSGFQALSPPSPYVAIHDAARPFITAQLVRSVLHGAREAGAAAPGLPLKETLKRVHAGLVQETLPRESTWAMQTPQILGRAVLQKGLEQLERRSLRVTDDAALSELIDSPVKVVEGLEQNIKITSKRDLLIASQWLEATRACATA